MADLNDVLEVYAELKRLKREIRSASVGEELETEPVAGVRIEGKKGELRLVYRITGE